MPLYCQCQIPDDNSIVEEAKAFVNRTLKRTKRRRKPELLKLILQDLNDDDEDIVAEVLAQIGEIVEDAYNQTFLDRWDGDDKEQGFQRVSLVATGGHLAVIQILKKFPESAQVQYEGIRVLREAAERDDLHVHAVFAIGGLEWMVDQLESFQTKDAGVVEEVLRGILALHERERSVLRRFVEDHWGIPPLVKAMAHWPVGARLQSYACQLLLYVTCREEYIPTIRKCGGNSAIDRIVSNYHLASYSVAYQARVIKRRLDLHDNCWSELCVGNMD